MKTASLIRAMRPVLAIGALLIAGAASAVSVTMVPSQKYFDLDAASHTLTVDFVLGGGATSADTVLRAFDFLVAYNPGVLTYQSTTFYGTAFGGSGAMPPDITGLTYFGPPDSAAINYLNGRTPDALPGSNPALGSALGTYMGTPFYKGPIATADYYEGSLNFKMIAEASILTSALVTAQSGVDIKLFSIVFDVAVDQIAKSSIVMLDDTSFTTSTPATLDAKDGDGDIIYLTKPAPNANEIKVPVPGTLALLGAGLIGYARRRRTH